nr:uncharacterized protein LOC113801248 [Penaeus vannamei]
MDSTDTKIELPVDFFDARKCRRKSTQTEALVCSRSRGALFTPSLSEASDAFLSLLLGRRTPPSACGLFEVFTKTKGESHWEYVVLSNRHSGRNSPKKGVYSLRIIQCVRRLRRCVNKV